MSIVVGCDDVTDDRRGTAIKYSDIRLWERDEADQRSNLLEPCPVREADGVGRSDSDSTTIGLSAVPAALVGGMLVVLGRAELPDGAALPSNGCCACCTPLTGTELPSGVEIWTVSLP